MQIVIDKTSESTFVVELYQGSSFVRVLINGVPVIEFTPTLKGIPRDKPAIYINSTACEVISAVSDQSGLGKVEITESREAR